MNRKSVFFTLFIMASSTTVLAAPAPDPSAPEPGHLVARAANSDGAVTRQSFEARFEARATQLSARMPGVKADRFAAFDIAWPHDAQEWGRLNGNAVLLTGALSQDGSELPLAKLYLVHADGSRVLLKRIGSARRLLPPDTKSGAIFGQNLSEEFYLVPVAALDAGTQLQCDFVKNRLGFVLAHALAPPPRFAGLQGTATPPPLSAIKDLVAREYPDFDIELSETAP